MCLGCYLETYDTSTVVTILVGASIAVKKQSDQKQLGEERVYLIYYRSSPLMEAKAGTQGRNLEAVTEAEAME